LREDRRHPLLRLTAGQESLDSGEIMISGRPVSADGLQVSPEDRKIGIGVVFQSYALWPHMTVKANVSFQLEATGTSKSEVRRQSRQHLRSVELEAFATRKPAQTINHRRPQKPAETLC
jgi:ABC-type Fe3+/spermidine/putrescine transport system ATPase subunit